MALSSNDIGREVQIKGVAGNAKAGAVLISADGEVVYLRGVSGWEARFIGKRIVAEGVLHRDRIFPDVAEDGATLNQGMPAVPWSLVMKSFRLDEGPP